MESIDLPEELRIRVCLTVAALRHICGAKNVVQETEVRMFAG